MARCVGGLALVVSPAHCWQVVPAPGEGEGELCGDGVPAGGAAGVLQVQQGDAYEACVWHVVVRPGLDPDLFLMVARFQEVLGLGRGVIVGAGVADCPSSRQVVELAAVVVALSVRFSIFTLVSVRVASWRFALFVVAPG